MVAAAVFCTVAVFLWVLFFLSLGLSVFSFQWASCRSGFTSRLFALALSGLFYRSVLPSMAVFDASPWHYESLFEGRKN